MTSSTQAPPGRGIQRIVIAGGGASGWMVAAGLAKCLGRQLDIRLIDTGDADTLGGAEATLPSLRLLHDILDVDEQEFMQATGATFKLGTRFERWRQVNAKYFHAFGKTGSSHWTAGFVHFWLEARRRGLAGAYGDYCLEHRAGVDGRFGRLPNQGLDYAYHFDATLYGQYLRRLSLQLGVRGIEGRIGKVHLDAQGGHVTGLTLDSGKLLDGDLFIDCTGTRSLLLGQALGVPYQSWAHWLPCDSAVSCQTAQLRHAEPYSRAIAQPGGWQWQMPLQHRVDNGLVYSSSRLSDEDAKAALLAGIQGEPIRPVALVKFTPGQREVAWKQNCIAIGPSGGFLEPLQSSGLHLVQQAVIRLIRLFPGAGICQSDIDEYNAQTRQAAEDARDLLILHYHCTERENSPFWRDCTAVELPQGLRHRIQQFRDSARVVVGADEPFSENAWVQVLLGQGVTPLSHHPITRQMDDHSLADFLEGMRKAHAGKLMKLPGHQSYLKEFCPAPRPGDLPVTALLRINPNARLQSIELAGGGKVYVVDDFAENPLDLVRHAENSLPHFTAPPGQPYPGLQLGLTPEIAGPLAAFFQRRCSEPLGAGLPLGMWARYGRVTLEGAALDARQRICHRDDSVLAIGQMMCASVVYLFRDEQLGGTVFFRSLMSAEATQAFFDDANSMHKAVFERQYGLTARYMTQSSRYFEVIGRVPAKWNRAVFYDGGIYHSADIQDPLSAAHQTGPGRLTINAFFKCLKG